MPTIFLIILLIAAYLIQRWSMDNAIKGVAFTSRATRTLAAPNERFELITSLANSGWRFIPFVQMSEIMPAHTQIHARSAVTAQGDRASELKHVSKVYLMPRSTLVRRVPVSLPQRGRHLFSGAVLRGGDFLGLEESYTTFAGFNEVVVYPEAAEDDYLAKVLGGFIGDQSVRRFIFEDPVLTVGYNEYTGREPMKAISWTASARSGRMMVKSLDYTTEISVSVVLSLETKSENYADLIEKSLSIAHQVCLSLERRKIKYDFFSNIVSTGAVGKWKYVSEGLGKGHLRGILEGLGRAAYDADEPFSALAERAKKQQKEDRSIIYIVPDGEVAATDRDLVIRAERMK